MEEELRSGIAAFVAGHPENRLPEGEGAYFDAPLLAFASSSDPIFSDFKKVIGHFHLAPAEFLSLTFGVPGAAGTVICWALPVSETVRTSNQGQARHPSREWALTRDRGEKFNTLLRRHVVDYLIAKGYRALAPQLSPLWCGIDDSPSGIASAWSERHAAYAAGLGTFSLNDGLITERGIAHRLGSVITDLIVSPTPRRWTGTSDHCLRSRGVACSACIDRCPVGALSPAGHDKNLCREYVYNTVPEVLADSYGVIATGCGLCQTRVPCEACIPAV